MSTGPFGLAAFALSSLILLFGAGALVLPISRACLHLPVTALERWSSASSVATESYFFPRLRTPHLTHAPDWHAPVLSATPSRVRLLSRLCTQSMARMHDDEEERALMAAYGAQHEALAAATDVAQNAVGHDDLIIFDQRFGVLIAKQERTGPLDFSVIERLATHLVTSAPPPIAGAQAATANTSIVKEQAGAPTVILVHTFSQHVCDGLVAEAHANKLLACVTDQVHTVPKIAAAMAGATVLRLPIPRGDFNCADAIAVRRHVVLWLRALQTAICTIAQNGHPFGPHATLELQSATPTPR
jgi:hypothetical protein